jgi:hypothetical protein
LQESWATRHVFTHNDGVIDDKFVSKVPGSAKLGQRARVTEPMCRQAITDVRALCAVVVGFHGTERAAFMSAPESRDCGG